MFSVVNAARPRPRNATNPANTSGRRDRQNKTTLRSISAQPHAASLLPFVLHKDRAASHHTLTQFQAVANLKAAALLDARRNGSTLKHRRLLLDPHKGLLAFPDHRTRWNRRRLFTFADCNFERGKHF